MAAFASFISQGGFFTVTNASSALFHRGPPPHIDLPQTMLTPSNSMLSDSLFKLTHEIYHHIHRTMPDGLVTKEQWAYNEAIASFETYKTLERTGMVPNNNNIFDGVGVVVNAFKNAESDTAAMESLKAHYRNKWDELYPPQ